MGDTDTVAAIAGGLLGAAYGVSAVPAQWRRVLHGWPGMRTRDLVELASAITRKGQPDEFDFTYSGYETGVVVRHPYDDGVWLGDIGALRSLPDGVDAVVSLCRVSKADLPARAEQIDVRLIDQPGVNDNLDCVLLDTVRAVEQLRREGRTVLIHCVQAQSRTPTIATLYARDCAASASTTHWLMCVGSCRTQIRSRSFAMRCDDCIELREKTAPDERRDSRRQVARPGIC